MPDQDCSATLNCFKPNRALGQNFLVSQRALLLITDSLRLGPEDVVVEIGPGTGNLTYHLAKKIKYLVAIEIDQRLKPILENKLQEYLCPGAAPKVEIIWEDALKVDLMNLKNELSQYGSTLKVAANLPYYVTTDLMLKLLSELYDAHSMVFTVQHEVVSRIMAKPGTRQYSPLSVLASLYGDVKSIAQLSPDNFQPRPTVRSTVLLFSAHVRSPLAELASGIDFMNFLRFAFTLRRKQFLGRLRREGYLERYPCLQAVISDFIEEEGLKQDFRIEELSPLTLFRLYNQLTNQSIILKN
ncbi:MAG TPA: ribosomal RNA small subunit methyltransferase A [Clostridiaceae bacterium]|nr:ribosomal RNA small subunit methyltransferase A [Clostridiaceae bacterium]